MSDTQRQGELTGPKTVIVVGGGVLGITSAYYLAEKGFQVTVLEKNSSVADWGTASHQNGGLLCPGYAFRSSVSSLQCQTGISLVLSWCLEDVGEVLL
jgi:D-amino-acid dehydrogenase